MSLRKRLTILAGAAVASVAVITVTGGSVALASTPTGTQIISNRTSECVTAQLSGAGIVQDACQNSAGQNWTFLGDSSNGNPFQLENLDTGLCADIQSFSNAAPVVQVPCGQQQIGAYWKYVPAGSREFPFVNLFHLQSPFANYCLDLENGWNTIGLSMQVWQCNFNTNNQIWYIF
jgi:hypothetical protein